MATRVIPVQRQIHDRFLLKNQLMYICEPYTSVNSSSAHPSPPGQPRGICRPHVVSPGDGAFAILSRPGGWAFDARVFESAMDECIGKDEAFVEQWLVRQGLDKLVDVFKGMFSQF